MPTVWKITRPDMTTYNGFRYERNVWTPKLAGGRLCTDGVYHAYLSPQLAVLLNPIHGDYPKPYRLWRCDADEIVARDDQLKVGVTRLRLQEEVAVPVIPVESRVTFAIHCALTVYTEPNFVSWATEWLSGRNQTTRAAAARAAARAATAWATAWAARAAARAAEAWAAEAAAWAAEEAAWAAEAAARAAPSFDLLSIAATALLPWEPTK